MGRVDLVEVETLEVEVALLKEAVQTEKLQQAESCVKFLKEILGYLNKDKDLLFLRLMTKYRLENMKGLRFTPDGKAIEFQDPPEVPPVKKPSVEKLPADRKGKTKGPR